MTGYRFRHACHHQPHEGEDWLSARTSWTSQRAADVQVKQNMIQLRVHGILSVEGAFIVQAVLRFRAQQRLE